MLDLDRRSALSTWLLSSLALLAVAALLLVPGSVADEGHKADMTLELEAFLSPGFGNEEVDMPAYVAYASQTTFTGPTEPEPLDRRLVSGTIDVPRSEWSPGEGADEWGRALGFVFGPLSPNPRDAYADSFYLWTGMQEGASVGEGDAASHIKVWPTSYDAYQIPHTPTEDDGTFAWVHEDAWPNVLHKPSTTRPQASIEGERATSPASAQTTGAMYVDQALLQVEGGDIDASTEPAVAPTFTFTQETPPGTVMNVQSVSYSRSGPWGDHVDLVIDFHTGIHSASTGEWRLPVDVTLEEGGYWPERVQPADIAAPQYTLGLNAKAVPLLPEEVEPGMDELHLVSDLGPGESYVTILGLLQEDGSVETVRLELDEPGQHVWRVAEGDVTRVPKLEAAVLLQGVGSTEGLGEASALAMAPLGGDGDLAEDDEGTVSTEPQAFSMQGKPEGFTAEVNEEGRPVVRNLTLEGTRLIDEADMRRILTPQGEIVLDASNRDGRAVTWEHPTEERGVATAAYHAEDTFVLVRFTVTPTSLLTHVDTHSLTGDPTPNDVEALARLSDVPVVDRLSGEVTEATRFLPGPLDPRLELSTAEGPFQLEPLSWDGAQVEVRNGDDAADGEALEDPTYAAHLEGNAVWGSWIRPLEIAPTDPTPPPDGAFTSLRTYRTTPELGLGNADAKFGVDPTQGVAIEPTRSFDGHEPIGIALGANDANGDPIRQDEVEDLYLHLSTLEGETFFSGTIPEPTFTPDEGETWGVILYPGQDLDPMDVHVYARATHDEGLLAMETSPHIPLMDRQFHIDRIPLTITSTEDATIQGTTQPLAHVTIQAPEVDQRATATANEDGAFAAPLDLDEAPGGDYEIVITATAPTPGEPKDLLATQLAPLPGQRLPEDDAATVTARLAHAPSGTNEQLHRDDDAIDQEAAAAFLEDTQDAGVWANALRPTAWATQGLTAADAGPNEDTTAYLDALASEDGYAWRANEAPNAVATGLAATTLNTLGEHAPVDPTAFLRWDGSADAGANAPASSLEATGMLALALDEAGTLDALDPWWQAKMTAYLEATDPASPAEGYATNQALTLLTGATPTPIPGDGLDAAAYNALTGTGMDEPLGPYQLETGGLSMTIDGEVPEAFPTGLALAAEATLER